jgi:hypothetical protein
MMLAKPPHSPGRHTAGRRETGDLILLDLNLPRKDGREVLKQIKPVTLDGFLQAVHGIDNFRLSIARLPGGSGLQ